jgi:hypothetical protein
MDGKGIRDRLHEGVEISLSFSVETDSGTLPPPPNQRVPEVLHRQVERSGRETAHALSLEGFKNAHGATPQFPYTCLMCVMLD